MKTANEWQNEMVDGNTTGIETIKQIQLDAWKQGMTDASEIAKTVYPSELKILTARDKKTEL